MLIGLAVLIAPNRRRAIIWAGLGGTIGIVLATIFLRRVRVRIVDSLDGAAQAVADNVFAQVGGSLRSSGIVVGVVAVLVAIVAYAAGRPPWIARLLASTKRVDGISPLEHWIAAHASLSRVLVGTVAVTLLWISGIGWISVGLIGALTALALWQVAACEARGLASGPAPLDGPRAGDGLPIAES